MDPDFVDVYTDFTVHSIHGTFQHGFREGCERRIPFIARNTPEDIKWLDEVCRRYKEEYGEEIEYYFDETLCYWKEKLTT